MRPTLTRLHKPTNPLHTISPPYRQIPITPTLSKRNPLRRVHTNTSTMSTPTPSEARAAAEASVKRNPHADFPAVQASRPDWDPKPSGFKYTKPPNLDWQIGDGANDKSVGEGKGHVEIDPYEEGRPAVFNYKLLISAIIPRPIAFLSTRSGDGMGRCVVVRRWAGG